MKKAAHRSASARQRRGSRPAGARRAAGADDSITNLQSRFHVSPYGPRSLRAHRSRLYRARTKAKSKADARIVRAVDDAGAAAPGNWPPARRPVRPPGGAYPRWECSKVREEGDARMATADL